MPDGIEVEESETSAKVTASAGGKVVMFEVVIRGDAVYSTTKVGSPEDVSNTAAFASNGPSTRGGDPNCG